MREKGYKIPSETMTRAHKQKKKILNQPDIEIETAVKKYY